MATSTVLSQGPEHPRVEVKNPAGPLFDTFDKAQKANVLPVQPGMRVLAASARVALRRLGTVTVEAPFAPGDLSGVVKSARDGHRRFHRLDAAPLPRRPTARPGQLTFERALERAGRGTALSWARRALGPQAEQVAVLDRVGQALRECGLITRTTHAPKPRESSDRRLSEDQAFAGLERLIDVTRPLSVAEGPEARGVLQAHGVLPHPEPALRLSPAVNRLNDALRNIGLPPLLRRPVAPVLVDPRASMPRRA